MARIAWLVEPGCEEAFAALRAAGLLPPPEAAAIRRKSQRLVWRLAPVPGLPSGAFLKAYRGRAGWKALRDTFWPSPVRREAARIRRFVAAGLPTAPLVATGHARRGILRGDTYLATAAIGDAATLAGVLASGDGDRRPAAVRAAAAALRRVHQAGFLHGDPRPENVLVRFPPGAAPEAFFLDLSQSRGPFRPAPGIPAPAAEDLARAARKLGPAWRPADSRMALRAYLGPAAGGPLLGSLLRGIRLASEAARAAGGRRDRPAPGRRARV